MVPIDNYLCYEVDGSHEEDVDLTYGDFHSPTYLYDLSGSTSKAVYFKTGFLSNTYINGNAYVYYMGTDGKYTWHEMSISHTHSIFNNCKVIIANSVGKQGKRFYIEIYKSGTDATKFTYTVYQGSLVV